MSIQEMQLYLIGFTMIIYLYKIIIHILSTTVFKNKSSNNDPVTGSDLELIVCAMIYAAVFVLEVVNLMKT
jgi:hypothetical protein